MSGNSDSAPPSSCKTILANTIAKTLLNEVSEGLEKLKSSSKSAPHLLGLLANDDPAAKVYADWTGKTCKEKYAPHLLNMDIVMIRY